MLPCHLLVAVDSTPLGNFLEALAELLFPSFLLQAPELLPPHRPVEKEAQEWKHSWTTRLLSSGFWEWPSEAYDFRTFSSRPCRSLRIKEPCSITTEKIMPILKSPLFQTFAALDLGKHLPERESVSPWNLIMNHEIQKIQAKMAKVSRSFDREEKV